MSRTKRKNWESKPIRDGEHGKKCPSGGCSYCTTGKYYKKLFNRLTRRKKIDDEQL